MQRVAEFLFNSSVSDIQAVDAAKYNLILK
jgi:hypothetical protein